MLLASKEKNGQVSIDFNEVLSEEYLDGQIAKVYKALMIVHSADKILMQI